MARIGLAVLATASALAAVAVVVWLVALRDTAEPASVEGAVTEFREGAGSGGESPVPEGVYVYATEGQESTDALTGVTHRYPARSTITVTRHPCGTRMRWDVLEGRSTVWVFCVDEEGWTLRTQDERHTFFGRTEPTTYRCTGVRFRPQGDEVGFESTATCTTGSTEEATTSTVEGHETATVAGQSVDAVQLRRASVFAGKVRGDATHELWLDRDSGVPVRVEMRSRTTNDSPIGDVVYEEDVTLRLTSLTPRR